MSEVPTISITNPELESQDLNLKSPVTPSPPPSPTVFDVVKNMEALDRDDMTEEAAEAPADFPETPDNNNEEQQQQQQKPPEEQTVNISDSSEEQQQEPATPEPSRSQLQQQQKMESTQTPKRITTEQDDLQDQQAVLNIREFYYNKSVLLTGATGFVGKALLWKLLSLNVGKIFILLRSGQRRPGSAFQRIKEDILTNKAFVALRRSMGPTKFDRMIKDKVYAIEGDLAMPGLGLSEEDRKTLVKYTNIVLHCGATVDGNERLDMAIKVNVLGTLNLIELANECMTLAAFIHMSPLQMASGLTYEDHLLPIQSEDSPHAILSTILSSSLEDLPTLFDAYKQFYPDTYLFSKCLAEHLIISEIERKRNNGGYQYPIAIMRSSPIGPSASEPLVGWADGVNGANGTLLLTGRGVRVIQPGNGNANADIVPVDFAVRMILGCAASITPPSSSNDFNTPITDIDAFNDQRNSTPTPSSVVSSSPTTPTAATTPSSARDSGSSSTAGGVGVGEVGTGHLSMGSQASSKATSVILQPSIDGPMGNSFPYMYHITTANLRCLPWRIAYEPIRQYWTKATKVNLAPAQSYFTSGGNGGLNRARTVMNSIRSYMGNSNNVSAPVPSVTTSNSSTDRARKRQSGQRLSRQIDKATKLSWTMKSLYKPLSSSTSTVDMNAAGLRRHLQKSSVVELDPYGIVPEDADFNYWVNYFLNASYGIHYFIHMEPDLRLPAPLSGWRCALQSYDFVQGNDSVRLIDRPATSVVFSADQITRRIQRMVDQVKTTLENNHHSRQQQDDERWLGDMDDSLDDWSQDGAVFSSDKENRMMLGKWRKKVGNNDDRVKIVVLNDKRVNQAISQITLNAGVQKQTAANEAIKILVRMSERTQLQFVWFASYFLKNLFDDMFENVRIQEESIRRIQHATLGKRVVYVPVSKSILDPLLVWYIAIRYHLPVPAFACDEALSNLGPISDIYRLAGAYYIKRDKHKRSPLNSAVMAAYTQVLLREHGALSICMDKARSRTGKYQEHYDDGLIDMVVESTLQSNQTRSPAVSRVASLESNTNNNMVASSPPASPDTPSSVGSPTMSVDSTMTTTNNNGGFGNSNGLRKVHKDVFIVPINITYENMPELPTLLDELLDQPQTKHRQQQQQQQQRSNSMPTPPSQMQSVMRPSEAKDKRNRLLEGSDAQRKFGRVLMGIGPLVSVQDAADQLQRSSSGSVNDPTEESILVKKITKEIQASQRKALIVSPVSLVASIILYGRATGGVCFGKMKDMAEWLRAEVIMREFQIDWQEGEDVDAVVLYAFRLLDETKNIIIEGKEITDDTNIRVNDHADNVMTLSYYANQAIDVFLLDAFFAVVYLSFTEEKVIEDEFMDRFRFLAQMLEREFVLSWDIDQQFNTIINMYEARKVIRRTKTGEDGGGTCYLQLIANMESNPVRYEQLIFLASLLYPTIDTYWITSCSLSALDVVPMLPRSLVPLLAQWIATHLITGRRTIYREVLSTESSRTAADVFMTLGFLTEIQSKEKLSPDAQILLHELGIPTTETLIQLSGQSNEVDGKTEISPVDPEGMMKALMAQIQMNRANSNMADLCQQIDTYRLGAMTQRETFQNKQVFQKCLKQIKGILQASTTGFAKKRHVELPENEEKLVQLVYALRTSSAPSVDRSSPNNNSSTSRSLRRVSEAYNLRH